MTMLLSVNAASDGTSFSSADDPTREDHFFKLPREIVQRILQYVNTPCLTACLSFRFAVLSRMPTLAQDFLRFFSEHTQKQVSGAGQLLSPSQTQREVYGKLHNELQQLGLDPVAVGLCFNDPSTYHAADSLIQAKNFCFFCSCISGIDVDVSQLQEVEDILLQSATCHQQFNALDIATISELNLKGLSLTRLPKEVGSLTHLTTLNLDHNELTELPAEIGNLVALQDLYLDHNQLTELPVEIGNLVALQSLFLHYNQLTELPVEIGNLTALQSLLLNNNRLTKIPAGISNLPVLQGMVFTNNPLL